MSQPLQHSGKALDDLLRDVQSRDRHRLRRQLQRARKAGKRAAILEKIEASAAKTRARLQARAAITLAPDLPISARGNEIAAAVASHQVVVVCGETGSGKTTQLPKILLQAGLGARGLIGHTQPRRLAARSVATRIAEELNTPLGDLVGYQTRLEQTLSAATQVKLMTDGILLAETAGDRFLNRYEAIILDEAHERTLNIDFLLGYIKRLLARRADLKLIVTSATIDPERFAQFFDGAPIINVEGRGYPVTLRYAPLDEDTEQPEAIEQAVHELWREGSGDILVFLPGERDIRDTERHLTRALEHSRYARAEIVPLYARLTRVAQNKVFAPGGGRRIVLATNVAETSLTVPGIRYVIDTGLARISRYASSARVQRLPIEPVSQASCDQRAGRCGRVAPGICIRLFSEEDYDQRPAFTDPEIQRTNLASVLLTMADLRLGDIDRFPFIDAPPRRYIKDGRNLLTQLQAMHDGRITDLGRRLARLPLDPRIGRMLVAGDEQGVLPAMRVIAAGLTIQDPRERPAAARAEADAAQAPFADARSDFVALLRLWDAFAAIKREQSGNQLRKWCRAHFVNFMRMREWEDLVRQLRRIGAQIGLAKTLTRGRLADCDYQRLHQALLPGLLDQFGRLDDSARTEQGTYLGARNRKFRIFPGSGVAGKTPRWLVAGELIETSRLFAHTVAAIEPAWLERAAAHLLTREYYEPHWSKRRGHTAARMRVRLFGQVLAQGRRVDFGRIDPAVAREIFIVDGLVPGQVIDKRGRVPAFLRHNQQIIEDIAAREARFRRHDLLVDERSQADFYAARLPSGVRDRKTLQQWLRDNDDKQLHFTEQLLLQDSATALPERAFPKTLSIGNTPLPLTYRFEPGADDDGVTVRLPLAMLNQFPTQRAPWLVPGLLEEKLREYLRALPKRLRRSVVPVPDFARAAAERLPFAEGDLQSSLRTALHAMTGVDIPPDSWAQFRPSPHLRMRFAVIDGNGKELAAGRDLSKLQQQLGAQASNMVQELAQTEVQQRGLTAWPDVDLADSVALEHGGVMLQATPALVDRGESVDLQLVDDAARAHALHRQGVIRLLRIGARKQARLVARDLDGFKLLAALSLPEAPATALADADIMTSLAQDAEPPLLADMLQAIVAARCAAVPRNAAGFDLLLADIKSNMFSDASELWIVLKPSLQIYKELRKRLRGNLAPNMLPAVNDISEQLEHLIYGGFISNLREPYKAVQHVRRYLEAIEWRLRKWDTAGVDEDRECMRRIAPYWAAYKQRAQQVAKQGARPQELLDFRWMVEEFRVQLFAQPLGTAIKVSPQRLDAALARLG
ncbi:MAG TPA: ATP-dependent RNA helicase HrpA [Salinisphaeraceae bacterium]|nr:ATP-dependent RNA helicase HrpA [Salinisphaeraceae bacterium]